LVIIAGDSDTETIVCSGSAEHWECSEIEPLDDSLLRTAGPFSFFSATDLQLFDVTEAESRTVEGLDIHCLRLSPRDRASEVTEHCLSKDGVPIYAISPFGTVEATEFSAQVSDEDFVPPAEPQ
jgi:hypothetical protein